MAEFEFSYMVAEESGENVDARVSIGKVGEDVGGRAATAFSKRHTLATTAGTTTDATSRRFLRIASKIMTDI